MHASNHLMRLCNTVFTTGPISQYLSHLSHSSHSTTSVKSNQGTFIYSAFYKTDCFRMQCNNFFRRK